MWSHRATSTRLYNHYRSLVVWRYFFPARVKFSLISCFELLKRTLNKLCFGLILFEMTSHQFAFQFHLVLRWQNKCLGFTFFGGGLGLADQSKHKTIYIHVSMVLIFCEGLLGSPVPMELVASTLNSYSTHGLNSTTRAVNCCPPRDSGTEERRDISIYWRYISRNL